MELRLRYYQKAAIEAVAEHFRRKGSNPCIEIPTGGGKSPVIAVLAGELAREGNRVLILAHRKELLEQMADKFRKWEPAVDIGIYSAGLNLRELGNQVILAGIQSVYKRGIKLSEFGKIDFLIVDECHLIPPSSEMSGGMFRKLIDDLTSCNPNLGVIGFTATPYRLGSGLVCGPKNVLNEICYSVGVRELVNKGYLCPLVSRAGKNEMDFSSLKIEHGEFASRAVEELYDVPSVVRSAVAEILLYGKNRNSCLIFCSSVKHAKSVFECLRSCTEERCELVTGETKSEERGKILQLFSGGGQVNLLGEKEKPVKYLLNVDVLTTGFDAPNIDFIVLLRPTASPGLYYQMVGRGFRIHESKKDCLIADFGGNIQRHGPVDDITIKKEHKRSEKSKVKTCPHCLAIIETTAMQCPFCFFHFEEETLTGVECPFCKQINSTKNLYCFSCGKKFPVTATHSGESEKTHSVYLEELDNRDWTEKVVATEIYLHQSKKEPEEQFLRISYRLESGITVSEFLNFDAPRETWKRKAAALWWVRRSRYKPVPASSIEAEELLQLGVASEAVTVRYRPATPLEKYPKLLEVYCGEKPEISVEIDPGVRHCKDCQLFSDGVCYLREGEIDCFQPICDKFADRKEIPF